MTIAPPPTTEKEKSVNAENFFNNAGNLMANLAGRWLDEQQYEDINDYKAPLQKLGDDYGVTITAMSKRPFGCTFQVDGRTYEAKIYANGNYTYKRIA